MYRKKSDTVSALQWTGGNLDEMQEFCGERPLDVQGNYRAPRFDLLTNWTTSNLENTYAVFGTSGGWQIVAQGAWVVCENGDFKVLSDEDFQANYEEVADE